MKKIIGLFALILSAVTGLQAQQKFIANLSGAQVVPPTQSVAKGVCSILPDANFTSGSLSCSYSGLSGNLVKISIHGDASVGQNAPDIVSFTDNAGTRRGAFVTAFFRNEPLTMQAVSNKLYIVFKTENFPNGEIRGQFHLPNSAYNDYDGDGRTDITLYRNSNNTFYALRSLDRGFIQQRIGQPGDSVSLTVDFDGDGRSDFSTARYNSEVLWRIFKGTTETLTETRWGSSALGDFFAAADYDGDMVFDIAVFRAGVWYIIESSTGNFRYEYFGQAGDVPAPNDFDKDGIADLAVARNESGRRVWYFRRSSDGQFYGVQWGLSSDAFFTGKADYDGDGAQDISVIRNESGTRVFYIRRSSDGAMQVIRWGLSSDVVKLGDYDGDGRTDAAVTRAINGQRVFCILQSSNGAPRYETFGLAGDF